MMTEDRLSELERAAAGCIGRGHPNWVLSLAAGELAELCAAARYGHKREVEPHMGNADAWDAVPPPASNMPENGEEQAVYEGDTNEERMNEKEFVKRLSHDLSLEISAASAYADRAEESLSQGRISLTHALIDAVSETLQEMGKSVASLSEHLDAALAPPGTAEHTATVEMLEGALRHLDDVLHKIPADTWQWTHISAAKSLLQSVLRVLVFEAAGDSEE